MDSSLDKSLIIDEKNSMSQKKVTMRANGMHVKILCNKIGDNFTEYLLNLGVAFTSLELEV